uniref:Uncharacterized protein n=1 Tax=Micrococcus phage Kurnik TaxID=3092208 RepID=A0AAU6R661_9CAUD
MNAELRCAAKKHGELIIPGSGILEVSCNSTFCGKRSGVVILHRFDLATGELVDTNRYKEIGASHVA